MQRDLKIGLALGILMVGGGLAFFFGSAQDNRGVTPLLQNEELLDQEIVETKSRIPYLVRPEFESEPIDAKQPVTLHPPLTQTPPEFDLPDFLRGDDAAFQESALARNVPAPEPIRNILSPNVPNREWRGVASRTSAGGVATQKGMRTHTIQPGDTLTGLAAQYLGSHARFREIYECNKELLPSPDRLPVGVVLQIPPDKGAGSDPLAHIVSNNGDKPKITQGTITDVKVPEVTAPEETIRRDPLPEKPREQSVLPQEFAEPDDADFSDVGKRFSASRSTPFTAGRTREILNGLDEAGDPLLRDRAPASAATKRTYTVRKGDTLQAISVRIFGNPNRAQDIFEANRGKVSSPDTIREGMILELP